MPPRKPGLWEMKIIIEGRSMPPHALQHCVDAETDKLMNSFGRPRQEMCSKKETKKVGATTSTISVCKVGPATMTTHAVVTGNFNSAYTVKMSTDDDRRHRTCRARGRTGRPRSRSRRASAAPARPDQKPGDMILRNGIKMNIRDMQRVPVAGAE